MVLLCAFVMNQGLEGSNNQRLLGGRGQTFDRYTLVLQEIGNSILVQADELIRKYKYDTAQRDLTAIKSELQGLKIVLGKTKFDKLFVANSGRLLKFAARTSAITFRPPLAEMSRSAKSSTV